MVFLWFLGFSMVFCLGIYYCCCLYIYIYCFYFIIWFLYEVVFLFTMVLGSFRIFSHGFIVVLLCSVLCCFSG